jgi:hypothetical protein
LVQLKTFVNIFTPVTIFILVAVSLVGPVLIEPDVDPTTGGGPEWKDQSNKIYEPANLFQHPLENFFYPQYIIGCPQCRRLDF